MNEKTILGELTGDFIVNMRSAFQDRENLYLVLDLLTGGDMRFHLCYFRKFSEEQTRFFAACIILALKAIHKNGYIHRDIKPENLVFDEKGFLKLTDFGIARKVHPENGKETSGTPGYMAPEVMCRQNHSFEVDFYALGVICYESMLGRRPYNGRSRKEIRDQILAKQVQIRHEEVPKGWSAEAVDFINQLIQRKPQRRLGSNGIKEIIEHKWFRDFKWKALESRTMNPPFVPNVRDVFDYLRSLTEEDSEIEEEDLAQNELLIRRKSVQGILTRPIQRVRFLLNKRAESTQRAASAKLKRDFESSESTDERPARGRGNRGCALREDRAPQKNAVVEHHF